MGDAILKYIFTVFDITLCHCNVINRTKLNFDRIRGFLLGGRKSPLYWTRYTAQYIACKCTRVGNCGWPEHRQYTEVFINLKRYNMIILNYVMLHEVHKEKVKTVQCAWETQLLCQNSWNLHKTTQLVMGLRQIPNDCNRSSVVHSYISYDKISKLEGFTLLGRFHVSNARNWMLQLIGNSLCFLL